MNGEALKFLVADDDPLSRRLMVACLKGHQVRECADGLQALALYDSFQPDVVLLDVEMPGLSGPQVAARLRAQGGERYVPILLVSGHDEVATTVAGLDSGADAFVTKPFHPRVFESQVQVFLRLREMNRRIQTQNQELTRFRESMREELQVAEATLTRMLKRGALNDARLRMVLSPYAMFNGDVVVAAPLPDGGFRWMLGDVAGHGLAGALGTLPLTTLFFEGCGRGLPLGTLVQAMDLELQSTLPGHLFVAAALLELDASRTRLSLWNGGLPPVLLRQAQGREVVALGSSDLPLGIQRTGSLEPRAVVSRSVAAGDRILAFSDGVMELRAADGALFGLERVREAVQAPDDAALALDRLVQALREFSGGTQSDDLALVQVEV